jgi:hypothetical protein
MVEQLASKLQSLFEMDLKTQEPLGAKPADPADQTLLLSQSNLLKPVANQQTDKRPGSQTRSMESF